MYMNRLNFYRIIILHKAQEYNLHKTSTFPSAELLLLRKLITLLVLGMYALLVSMPLLLTIQKDKIANSVMAYNIKQKKNS